jgi:hypothetical protein
MLWIDFAKKHRDGTMRYVVCHETIPPFSIAVQDKGNYQVIGYSDLRHRALVVAVADDEGFTESEFVSHLIGLHKARQDVREMSEHNTMFRFKNKRYGMAQYEIITAPPTPEVIAAMHEGFGGDEFVVANSILKLIR